MKVQVPVRPPRTMKPQDRQRLNERLEAERDALKALLERSKEQRK